MVYPESISPAQVVGEGIWLADDPSLDVGADLVRWIESHLESFRAVVAAVMGSTLAAKTRQTIQSHVLLGLKMADALALPVESLGPPNASLPLAQPVDPWGLHRGLWPDPPSVEVPTDAIVQFAVGVAVDQIRRVFSGFADPPQLVETLDEGRKQATRQHTEGAFRAVQRAMDDGLLSPEDEAEVNTYLRVIDLHLQSPKPDQVTISRNIGLITATIFKSGGQTGEAVRYELLRINANPPEIIDLIVSAVAAFVDSMAKLGAGSTNSERTEAALDTVDKAAAIRSEASKLRGYDDSETTGRHIESERSGVASFEWGVMDPSGLVKDEPIVDSDWPDLDESYPRQGTASITLSFPEQDNSDNSEPSVNVIDEFKKGAISQTGKNTATALTDRIPELVSWFADMVLPLVQSWMA